ncbi:hypothetical protein KAR91_39190 [Candidatus Pacearchaeota archaeon]|nr:hypothetical protein [Candidatus Pacearchaeota archaeon]
MRKLILLAILLTPFLVCDPNPGAEKVILEINGTEIPEFATEADGSFRYDLAGMPDGDMVIRAKAGNVWGWSGWSVPFQDTKAAPGAFGGLRVLSE